MIAGHSLVLGCNATLNEYSTPITSVSSNTFQAIQPSVSQQPTTSKPSFLVPTSEQLQGTCELINTVDNICRPY